MNISVNYFILFISLKKITVVTLAQKLACLTV